MLPNITLVQVNPFLLNTGETNIVVTATVTDDGGVIDVVVTAETPLTLESGDSQNGIYTGTVVIPLAPDIIDGLYGVAVLAANAEAVQGDLSTYAINTDSMITLQRGNGGNGGNADDDNSDKGCCKVSINISSGPVNIYVCGTESK